MTVPPTNVVITAFSIIAVTGAAALTMKKVGPIALWGVGSALILMAMAFEYSRQVIFGIGIIIFLLESIAVVLE